MSPAAERRDRCEFVSPADCVRRKRFQQNPTKISPGYLGSTAGAVVGLIEQDVAVLVQYAGFLTARVDDLEKLLEESRRLECKLPVVFVDVEHAALPSRTRRGFRFVDRRSNTVNMEGACKGEAAESGADDRDCSIHGVPCVAREPPQEVEPPQLTYFPTVPKPQIALGRCRCPRRELDDACGDDVAADPERDWRQIAVAVVEHETGRAGTNERAERDAGVERADDAADVSSTEIIHDYGGQHGDPSAVKHSEEQSERSQRPDPGRGRPNGQGSRHSQEHDQKRPRSPIRSARPPKKKRPPRAAHPDRAQQEDGGGSRNAMIESVGNKMNERDKNAKRGDEARGVETDEAPGTDRVTKRRAGRRFRFRAGRANSPSGSSPRSRGSFSIMSDIATPTIAAEPPRTR